MCKSYLVEFKNIKKFKKFAVFLVVLKFDVVLLKSMKSKLGFIVDVHFHRLYPRLNYVKHKKHYMQGFSESKRD